MRSRIICGPFWGSFAVGDHLRYCTAVLRKLFDIRFSSNHCNFSRVCLLVKMVSKTVTRSILSDLLTFQISGNRNRKLFNPDFSLHDEASFLFSSILPIRIRSVFNNYSPKAKLILLNNPRDEVEGIIQQY